MQYLLPLFIALPALAFVASLLIDGKREKLLSALAYSTVGTQFLLALVYTIYWLTCGADAVNVKEFVIFRAEGYEFFVDLVFDRIGATFLLVGSMLAFLITVYSRYYLHRESGYKRFFNSVLFFYLGYCITVLSGNFETLFIGWEILGISSFLLIAFYRDRYLPVKNAVKVFSIYRVGDIGLILVMWLSHHLWGANIAFINLSQYDEVHDLLHHHTEVGLFISAMLLLTAMAKSAMFPFSPWLPRAMEGPTPSSAIFYGSLSVHMGVFLLLRTFPFWEHQIAARWMIGGVGLISSLLATPVARVQSSIKAQVAYASIAQIGLIFIELALGLDWLALIHFAGNAFLRTYQLLVSPSVVAYMIRDQFYHFESRQRPAADTLPRRLEYTFYLLSLREWNLESILYRMFWHPMKSVGRRLNFLTVRRVMLFIVPVLVIGSFLLIVPDFVLSGITSYLPVTFALFALIMMLKAFTERKSVEVSWLLIFVAHCWVSLAISFNDPYPLSQVMLYMSGIMVSALVGYIVIRRLRSKERYVNMTEFHGHAAKHPKLALLFLLCCLGLAGFPISPTFIGEDLMFTHMHENQVILAAVVSITFIVDGLAVIRIYARIFLGPHSRSVRGTAKRST